MGAVPPSERERLAAFARTSLDWQDRLLGVIWPDSAAQLLRRIAGGEASATDHGARCRLQAALAWQQVSRRPGADALRRLDNSFPSELWSERFVTAPTRPWGPMTEADLGKACANALDRTPGRPTLAAVGKLAQAATKKNARDRERRLDALRALAFADDGHAIAAELVRQGALVRASWAGDDRVEAPSTPELSFWAAEGCIRRDALPWDGGRWEALMVHDAPALVRALALLGLPPSRFASSLRDAPEWLAGDHAWATMLFAAHSSERFGAAADLQMLAEAQPLAVAARKAARSVGGRSLWDHRHPWPGAPRSPSRRQAPRWDEDYGLTVLLEVSRRYRAVLPQLPEAKPAPPAPWPARLRRVEGDLNVVANRPIDDWPAIIVRTSPWQTRAGVLRAFGWRPGWAPGEELRSDDLGHRLIAPAGSLEPELFRVLASWASEGDANASAVLAFYEWSPAPLRWREFARRWPTGGRALAIAFKVAWSVLRTIADEEARRGERLPRLRAAAATVLQRLPDPVLDVRLLGCIQPASVDHPTVRAEVASWGLDSDRLARMKRQALLPVDLCVDVARRLERTEVLRSIARLPWRLLLEGAAGRRRGDVAWVGPPGLRVPDGVGEPTPRPEGGEDAPETAPTLASVLEDAMAVGRHAAEALLELGDPGELLKVLDGAELTDALRQHRRNGSWLRGPWRALDQAARACGLATRSDEPFLAPPARVARSLEVLLDRRTDRANRFDQDGNLKSFPARRWESVKTAKAERHLWGAEILAPDKAEQLRAAFGELPRHLATARQLLLCRDPEGRPLPTGQQRRLTEEEDRCVRAVAWLVDRADPDLSKGLKGWLARLEREHNPEGWGNPFDGCADTLESARVAAARTLLGAGDPETRIGLLNRWLLQPGDPVLGRAVRDTLWSDDRLLDELWDLQPRVEVRRMLADYALRPDPESSTFRASLVARRPWAVEALAALSDEALRRRLPQCTGVVGIERLIRRLLEADLQQRCGYAWAALLSLAETRPKEWEAAIRRWALDDPEPWSGRDDFAHPHDDYVPERVLGSDVIGGDGVLLAGLRDAIHRGLKGGAALRRDDWRVRGLRRLWTLRLQREPGREGGWSVELPWPRDREAGTSIRDLFGLIEEVRLEDGETLLREALRSAGLPLVAKEVVPAPPAADPWTLGRVLDCWVGEVAAAEVIRSLALSPPDREPAAAPAGDKDPDTLARLRRHHLALEALWGLAGQFPDDVLGAALPFLADSLASPRAPTLDQPTGVVLHVVSEHKPAIVARLLAEHVDLEHPWRPEIEAALPELSVASDGSTRESIARLEREWSL